MEKIGLLVNYEYCTGCHSCELACRNEKGLPLDKWGIKVSETDPFEAESDVWEWSYLPVLTVLCDLCEERVGSGEDPACVHHCLAKCMDYGPLDELLEKMKGKGRKTVIYQM